MARELMSWAAGWLSQVRESNLAVTVTYQRGGQETNLSATRGRSQFTLDGPDGATVAVESVDWIVSASDLALGGQAVEPRPGDTITDPSGVRHSVLNMPGVNPWQWSDNGQTTYRIHSKRLDRRVQPV